MPKSHGIPKTRKTFFLSEEINEVLDVIALTTGITKSLIIEHMLVYILENDLLEDVVFRRMADKDDEIRRKAVILKALKTLAEPRKKTKRKALAKQEVLQEIKEEALKIANSIGQDERKHQSDIPDYLLDK